MKQVNPKIYNKSYYLETCLGAEEFKKSKGKLLHPTVEKLLAKLLLTKNMTVLDIGCGRGDITFHLAKRAKKAIGIDYSKDAIAIATDLKKQFPENIQKRTQFYIMDAKKLKFPNNSIDVIVAIDVFEHLYKEELEIVMREITRVLKPKGLLFVHTGTNKILYNFTYRYYTYPLNRLLTSVDQVLKHKSYRNLPKNPRTNAEKEQHVNEPTYRYLKKLFRNHKLTGSIAIEIGYIKEGKNLRTKMYNFLIALYPLSKLFPLNLLFGWNFICLMRKK